MMHTRTHTHMKLYTHVCVSHACINCICVLVQTGKEAFLCIILLFALANEIQVHVHVSVCRNAFVCTPATEQS